MSFVRTYVQTKMFAKWVIHDLFISNCAHESLRLFGAEVARLPKPKGRRRERPNKKAMNYGSNWKKIIWKSTEYQ